jgi:hypothetical protein
MKCELHIDRWETNVDKGFALKVEQSSLLQQLQLLDGKVSTQMLVLPEDKSSSLLIGGGKNNIYVVTLTIGADEEFFNLFDPYKNDIKEIEVVTGGQAGLFPEKYCVDFNMALEALKFYVETGQPSPKLSWEGTNYGTSMNWSYMVNL